MTPTTVDLADLEANVPDGVGIDVPGPEGGWAVAVIGGRVYRARVAPVEHEGCDCTELCSMGPTCPGGMLARLPGSGCWRMVEGER